MDTLTTYDPVMEALHLREQLSSPSRRLGFFFGAGTSMAVGLDGITTITKKVAEMISEELRPCYQKLLDETGNNGNVEDVLNRVRVYRELLGDDALQSFNGISGKTAKTLEREICLAIYRLVNVEPPKGIESHRTLAQWIRSIERTYPVEIFTTNYDLLFERGMESEPAVPYFDGFVGASM